MASDFIIPRAAREDHSPQSPGPRQIDCEEQPLYFQQLLEHLRERGQSEPEQRVGLDPRPQLEPMVMA